MNTATLDGWVASVDQYGKAAWITLMVLGFIVFWPIGLALLAYLTWSGRMGCKGRKNHAWGEGRWSGKSYRMSPSGNSAFDEYRQETLRRLEDEKQMFTDFLDSLRKAKDKAEFDQFMNDRSKRAPQPEDDAPQATS